MKNTSKQSYKECKESGYMTKKQLEVYNILIACGPCTAAEINKITKSTSNHKRLSELKVMGEVMECGSRFDKETGKMVTLWGKAPTGYIPQIEDKKPSKASLEALLARYKDGRITSQAYDSGYIDGYTACINTIKGSVPINLVIPTKVWE